MASDDEHSAFRARSRDWYLTRALHARHLWLAQLHRMMNASGTETPTRHALDEIAAFVGRVAIGATTPADRGRMERLHAVLHGDQPLRVIVLECVEHALSAGDEEQAARNLCAMLTWKVDGRFSKLEPHFVLEQLRSGNSPEWIAAQLSAACEAFGDRPPLDPLDPLARKRLPNAYAAARRRLTES